MIIIIKIINIKQEINQNRKEFKAMCESLKAKVSMDGLFEWAHWITPEFEKYRYDTYFYVIPVDYSSSLNSSDDRSLSFYYLFICIYFK